MASIGMALAAGGMGRVDMLEPALSKAEELAPTQHQRSDLLAAAAWRLAITGNLSQARSLLLEAATRAEKSGASVVEAQLLSDIARLGDPGRVKARLEELASLCDGDLVAMLAAHAAALASRDPASLTTVGSRLETLGVFLLAAESYSSAADIYAEQGLGDKANQATSEARRLARECVGAHTPGLALSQVQVPLTKREIEITMLAMRGLTYEDMGRELGISPRTVHSHLQHIYRKAGITRRKELRLLLPNMNSN
jgi:DNA-binding CsgD family transcriptional regulator